MTYGEQVGFTYCLKNFISFSGALRLLQATQSMELKSDDATFVGVNHGNKISYDASAFGVGGRKRRYSLSLHLTDIIHIA